MDVLRGVGVCEAIYFELVKGEACEVFAVKGEVVFYCFIGAVEALHREQADKDGVELHISAAEKIDSRADTLYVGFERLVVNHFEIC